MCVWSPAGVLTLLLAPSCVVAEPPDDALPSCCCCLLHLLPSGRVWSRKLCIFSMSSPPSCRACITISHNPFNEGTPACCNSGVPGTSTRIGSCGSSTLILLLLLLLLLSSPIGSGGIWLGPDMLAGVPRPTTFPGVASVDSPVASATCPDTAAVPIPGPHGWSSYGTSSTFDK